METKEIDALYDKLNTLEKMFGIGGVFIVVAAVIILILTWKYLVRNSELIAEEASEQSLKKFQSQLDKELVRFQTKHQKQADAIHDTYQELQKLKSILMLIDSGEKFTAYLEPMEKINRLMNYRHGFKAKYLQNKLLFPRDTCLKIDALIPKVDLYIETYDTGVMKLTDEEILEEKTQGVKYLKGIWTIPAANTLDTLLSEVNIICEEIETEFRKLFGTNE